MTANCLWCGIARCTISRNTENYTRLIKFYANRRHLSTCMQLILHSLNIPVFDCLLSETEPFRTPVAAARIQPKSIHEFPRNKSITGWGNVCNEFRAIWNSLPKHVTSEIRWVSSERIQDIIPLDIIPPDINYVHNVE